VTTVQSRPPGSHDEPATAGPGPVVADRPLRLIWATLLAVAAGVALLLAFPPYGLWPLAPVGVALLTLAVRDRRLRAGAGLGLITGVTFFGPLLSWTNLHLGPVPWLLLTVFQAGYLALLGLAIAWISPLLRRRPLWQPLAVAALWSAQEWLRGRAPFGGFPWGRLAFSQADAPTLSLASVGGAPLVTFVVALAGGLLATAAYPWLAALRAAPPVDIAAPADLARPVGDAAGRADRGPVVGSVIAVGVAVAAMAAGLLIPLGVPTVAGPGDGRVTVAIVQGNVPRLGLDFNAQRQAVLNNHVAGTIALAEQVRAGTAVQPDLVVWPENSSDIDPLRDTRAGAAITGAANAIGAPILVGAVLRGPGEGQAQNAGIVWSPGSGAGQAYYKQHPVPFAEYMPLRPLFEPIARMITDQAKLLRTDFVAGDRPGVLTMAGVDVGDVICFEVAYDGVVRDTVRDGAQLLVVQTNNATFDVDEAAQQLAMVRLRAVEHGRDSLMASTVGISGFVTADGAVHDASGFDTADTMVRQLRAGDTTTLASYLGWWPEAVFTLLAVVLLAAGGWARRRGRPEPARMEGK
jgi:apolipoprotein N-acyltransferase